MKADRLLLVWACIALLAAAATAADGGAADGTDRQAVADVKDRAGGAHRGDPPPVRIYLPRRVLVEQNLLDLACLSVVRCEDAGLVKAAEGVGMGRAPFLNEKIVIDRRTILSRLASVGVGRGRVKFSGAEKVTVRREESLFGPDELLKAAEEVLEKERPGPAGCSWRLVGRPRQLVVPGSGPIELKAELAETSPADHAKVKVSAAAGDRPLGSEELLFKVVHPARQAVAKGPIQSGDVLTPENTRIETVMVERRPPADWTAPYGMIAARDMPAGMIIRPEMARPAKPAIVVKRNQNVVMRVRGFGFTVTAVGQALQDGRPGDFVRVRNVDTKRVLTAKVAFDGAVEPVFEEVNK